MRLKWYGHAAFRLEDDGRSVITDPYAPELIGYAPIAETADIVIISSDDDEGHCRADLIPGTPRVVNALTVALNGGQETVDGLELKAMAAAEWDEHPEHVPGQNGMYRFNMGGIEFGHMGDVGNDLSAEQTAFFEGVDVLLALAGGYLTITLDELKRVIDATQPKIVVPMHFRTLSYRPRNTHWIEAFLTYFPDEQVDFTFGAEAELTPADLPDQTRVLVMDYAR